MNKNIFRSNPWIGYVAVLLVGFLLGALLFRGCGGGAANGDEGDGPKLYTCSMCPQVKQDHPGKCPICGMDLIPVKEGETVSSDIDPDAVMMSDEAMALANIETEIVGSGIGDKEIRLFGKIEPDQRLQQTQAAYAAGRIEKLYINAVGDRVGQGQTLALIYSPELYASEQELLAAMTYPEGPQRTALVSAAEEKLRLMNITQAQIDEVKKSGKASPYIPLKANTSGTVIAKKVSQGDYVSQGSPILVIANLSRVWAIFQAYEGDLPFVKVGANVQFTSEALPGEVFNGRVTFIDPILDAKSRTAGVRVELANGKGLFKPEMLLTGVAQANMKQHTDDIVIPKSAVLWTGNRSVVYIKDDTEEQPTFMMRQITLGPALPDGYVVTDGIAEGEELVVNGVFAIDASAQLQGKRAMMSQD